MTKASAWVVLDGMFFRILERDISLVMNIFKIAMDAVLNNSFLDDEIRKLQLPIDFYEAALLEYAKICPLRPLLGVSGFNDCKEGDVVIHVDFDTKEVYSEIVGISQDINSRRPIAAF